jgi:hypothetical protein
MSGSARKNQRTSPRISGEGNTNPSTLYADVWFNSIGKVTRLTISSCNDLQPLRRSLLLPFAVLPALE